LLGRFFVSVVLAVSLLVSQAVGAQPTPKALVSSSEVAQFDTEHAAQKHCPKDTVVWLNANSGIYHERACVGTDGRNTMHTFARPKPTQPVIAIRGTGNERQTQLRLPATRE
jgi:hypothetical protein